MNDDEHAAKYRPPLLDLFYDDQDDDCARAARWPAPFEEDDIEVPEDQMWWLNETS